MSFLELFAFVILPLSISAVGLTYAYAVRWHADREARRIGK